MSAREENPWTYQIWHLAYPEGEARKLTAGLTTFNGVSPSKDANTLVTVQNAVLVNIWVEPVGGTGRASKVTFGTGTTWLFSWAEDGHLILEQKVNGDRNLVRVAPDGSDSRQLSSELGCYNITVSPEGRSIVCISEEAGDLAVWRVDTDGRNRKRLGPAAGDSEPQWSPDGRWIVYAARGPAHWPVVWKVSRKLDNPCR